MTDSGSYNNGVEKKIDSIHKDIRLILEHVARQTFINESYKNSIDELRKNLDEVTAKTSALENRASEASGALKTIRFALTLLCGVILGVCTWVAGSIIQANSDVALIKEKIIRLETDTRNHRGYNEIN